MHTRGSQPADADRAEHGGSRRARAWRRTLQRPVALSLLGVGLLAAACGGTAATPTTEYHWITTTALSVNHGLNTDQVTVLDDSKPSTNEAAGTFFARLGSACTALKTTAVNAQGAQQPPSAQLDSAWDAMLQATVNYASDCITLSRSHSTSDLEQWNSSLKTMDEANGRLNTVVGKIRSAVKKK